MRRTRPHPRAHNDDPICTIQNNFVPLHPWNNYYLQSSPSCQVWYSISTPDATNINLHHCSLRAPVRLHCSLRAPVRLPFQPTGSQQHYPYGLPRPRPSHRLLTSSAFGNTMHTKPTFCRFCVHRDPLTRLIG